MRCDQDRGLTPQAQALLAGCGKKHFTGRSETVNAVLSNHRQSVDVLVPVVEPCVRQEPSGRSYSGMFGDEYPLYKYTFREGDVFYEEVQAEPWSSGPVFFLALQDEDGNWVAETLWPEEDIENA